jgi:predicted TIM-barrel fold metal-dependent hydrolase
MHGYSVQDDCTRPVFEWAQSHRRAVFVHCGVLSVRVRKKLGLSSRFDMRFSNPVDLPAVALRYPEVPIIVPHFGAGYFPGTRWKLRGPSGCCSERIPRFFRGAGNTEFSKTRPGPL